MKRLFFGKLLIKSIFILSLFLLSANGFLQAATSPDAIGFRVMPNPDHLSPLRWYQDNIKVKGSPQALTVDGYEAVRDGRTVYINAANISGKIFYSNIYIISYNQNAESQTTDIFGQILAYWKFNTNLSSDGRCFIATGRTCAQSGDCAKGEYCTSQKARTIRDTKRLADLADIKIALADYQTSHGGNYPDLAAGSYLNGKTISEWPSWQTTLGRALGITMPLDPINKLGACPTGYDKATCWNQTEKKFDGTISDIEVKLPDDSRAYVYAVKTDGSYQLCAVTESGYDNMSESACASAAGQIAAPTISCGASANVAAPFTGYVNLTGANAAKFTKWSVEPVSPDDWSKWLGWQWQSAIGLTVDSNGKKVTALKTPSAAGNYSYKITVSVPGNGTSASAICEIKIGCTPSCPSASEVCSRTTDTRNNGCGGQCYVVGVKTDGVCGCTPTSPNCAENTCAGQTCNTGCATVQGTKCCSTCNAAGQPNCLDSNPGFTEAGVGSCCAGQTCYKCVAGFTWNGATCHGNSMPEITAFSAVQSSGLVALNWSVQDASGSHLSRIDFWRAPDAGNAPGPWTELVSLRQEVASLNIDASAGSVIDNPPAGIFWYGMHATNKNGNYIVEPAPPGPLKIIISSTAVRSYYIDANLGLDTNPGSSAQPFKTIQKAVSKVVPGDTVIVRNGVYTYDGNSEKSIVTLKSGGTSSDWITFRSENKGGAVIDGQNNPNGAKFGFVLYAGANYIKIQDFEIKNLNNTAGEGGLVIYGNHINIVGNHIHNIGNQCVNQAIYDIGITGMYSHGSDSVLIEENKIHDIGRLFPGENGCANTGDGYMNLDHAIYLAGVSNFTIRNNVFYNNKHGWSIHVYNSDGETNPTLISSNLTIVNNTFAFANPNRDGQIVLTTPGVNNATIENNIFYSPTTAGVRITSAMSNVAINKNITYGGVIASPSGAITGVTYSGNFNSTDPKLVNPAGMDFHLEPASPAVNAVINTFGLTTDFERNTRPSGAASDIGAFEY